LLAPFTPFLAEAMWRTLAAGRDGQPESVHLAEYPRPDPHRRDEPLEEAMQAVRDIVSLGRTVRTDSKVRVRQPLARAVVHMPGDPAALHSLLDLIAQELNVKRVEFAESEEVLAGWRAKPNYRVLGPRLGPRVQEVAAALQEDDGSMAAALAHGERVTVEPPSGEVEIGPDDVDLSQETTRGWGVAAEGGLTVALDLEVGPDLAREGLAREVVRLVQDARKAAGLEVTDRIELRVEADGPPAEAVDAHERYIAGEVLAVQLDRGDASGLEGGFVQEHRVDGHRVAIALRRV
jgi:isoleucyl-tRNA synthetase